MFFLPLPVKWNDAVFLCKATVYFVYHDSVSLLMIVFAISLFPTNLFCFFPFFFVSLIGLQVFVRTVLAEKGPKHTQW